MITLRDHRRHLLKTLVLLLTFQLVQPEKQLQSNLNAFVDSDHDLLALPSDGNPNVDRNGPVSSYAFDNIAIESKSGETPTVVLPPPGMGVSPSADQIAQETADQRMRRRKPVVTVAPKSDNQEKLATQQQQDASQHQHQQQSFGGYAGNENPYQPYFVPEYENPLRNHHYDSPAVAITPVVAYPAGGTTVVENGQYYGAEQNQQPVYYEGNYDQHYEQGESYPVTEGAGASSHKKVNPMDIYHDIVKHPYKIIKYLTMLATRFTVPKDHYLNVISFVGVYLFMSYIFYSSEDILQLTCEVTNGKKVSYKEWSYHAGRRFVPAQYVDKEMQLHFLQLFKGSSLDDNSGSSSSEEDFSGEIGHVSEMCPRGEFFYGLSPMHIEAVMQLQRLFVFQHSPQEVLHLAKDLLYRQKVHPKVWYLALVAAALERPDMIGYSLAHPIDAMPDLFIPAHLIKEDIDRKRALSANTRLKRAVTTISLVPRHNTTIIRISKQSRFSTASTTTTTTTPTTERTPIPIPDSAEMSGEFIGLDGSVIPSRPSTPDTKGETGPILNKTQLKKTLSLYRQQQEARANHNQHKGKKGKEKKKDHKKHKKECITVDGKVGWDNGVENKLWYWREDMMVNQHHWYWHQAYPLNATRHPDRRAELFFFMHRSILARYNAERMSNGLPRTFEMDFQPGGIIYEGYDSHLADLESGKYWSPRPPTIPLSDVIHEDDPNFARNILVPEVMDIYGRLLKAVKTGKMVMKSGKMLPIHHTKGIEPFSNTVEASMLSVNPMFYDALGFHNLGHLLIGLAADPFWKLKSPPGIMADQIVAMRDPAFYTLHAVVDNLIEKFKQTLPPYKVIGGEFPLLWRGVEVHHVELLSKGSDVSNQLRTFWTDKKFALSPGVDGSADVNDKHHAEVCAVHLAHEPFFFKFVVERKPCAKTKSGKATIRIFMAPRLDEKGRRLHFKDQRRLMFQLDAFQVKLRVGKNIITRRSHDSSLTKPWSRSLHEFEEQLEEGHGDPSGAADFCGCGWPQHLYIPKGHVEGMPFDLFVMATSFDEDNVVDSPQDLQYPETCNSPYIFCGHPRRRYPDARPMGYPFDRPSQKAPLPCKPGHSFSSMVCQNFNLVFHKPVDTLEQFVSKAPNMKSIVFDIKHIDHFVDNFHLSQ